ncbi:MAG TPA: adenylate/guanylate cyclase domain-containing protein [Xanthobacteraceae bacterium]|jgi:class 3 adenylate cyclase|nr:adenylate/guanylate cyclase domain-containing protein [Xanthobacteraceae bacterium]
MSIESPAPSAAEQNRSVEDWSQLSAAAERTGNYLGACDTALIGLEQHPQSRELQYRAILNLSRTGAVKGARQLWIEHGLQPNFESDSGNAKLEENIAALGARLDREEAYAGDPVERPAKLRKAAEHYESIYRRTDTTFAGVNAAVLYEFSGDTTRAKEIAARVVDACAKARPQSNEDAYQLAADRAAASLLVDDLDDARKTIEQAATLSGSAASVASTRKQLMQICEHKGIDPAIVSPLRNRNVIHYTGHMISPEGTSGRFPAHAEARVAGKIAEQLTAHNVGYGYGSLACGADTLIVEALLKRQAEIDVVLPFEPSSFLEESVANGGAEWLGRFEECRKQVKVTQATDGEYVGDAEVFAYTSRLAMGMAILRAQQLSSDVIQLAVWDGQETSLKAGSYADIKEWQSYGLKTIKIASEGNVAGGETTSTREPPRRSRKVRAIMFGDYKGFSKLSDRQMLIFYDSVVPKIAAVIEKYSSGIATRNTWGDGLFLVFSDLAAAAYCGLEIQSTLAAMDMDAIGLPQTFSLRLGVDAGAVFEINDPILRSISFTGSHVNRTARLEPSTPPGEVYVTEAFAALFTLLADKELTCDYVGLMRAAKNYGRMRTYRLRHRL